MRSLLRQDGTLPPPASLAWALARCKALHREIARIDLQLVTPRAIPDVDWSRRAKGAQKLFRRELELTEAWIGDRVRDGQAVSVLVDLREVLRTLKADDALEPGEVEVMQRFEEFLDGGG